MMSSHIDQSSSQLVRKDVGMLWYGVPGIPFTPADPSEVMLNAGAAAPLLSDQPRALLAPEGTVTYQGPTHQTITYADNTLTTQAPMVSYNVNSIAQAPMVCYYVNNTTEVPIVNYYVKDHQIFGPNNGDYINQTDYMYEAYETYDDDSCGTNNMGSSSNSGNPQNSPNFNSEDDNSLPAKTKKPKVHQHPSLKLKTPIAYQKDTDLNAIPIMKEGMAVCERCGAIGVKHAFYGKERKFCSLGCARGNSMQFLDENSTDFYSTSLDNNSDPALPPPQELGETQSLKHSPSGAFHTRTSVVVHRDANGSVSPDIPLPRANPTYLPEIQPGLHYMGFDWTTDFLEIDDLNCAPVHFFKHAPMSECWEQMGEGMKVEVSCRDEAVQENSYWVATVRQISGYFVKLRYEGFGTDSHKDFWVDLCSKEVHPVGWCASQDQALIPPKSIQAKYSDWKMFLKTELTDARTLPTTFQNRVLESQKSRFRPGLNLEVVDKNRIAQMRVASVTAVVGKRIHLRYYGASADDNGFWCHEDSPIIHPVGWSRETGHEIVASQSYHEKCRNLAYDADDASPDLFLTPSLAEINTKLNFKEGMKLEALDPLNLATICVATIMKVLNQNYLMIRIDSFATDDTGSDWFCYHASSPYIFSAGFCDAHNLQLSPPKGYQGEFDWTKYLTDTKASMAPSHLFKRKPVKNRFTPDMYLEAADLMDPRLVCVASVKEVNGRLLRIHFDGWDNEFDEWVDCQSCDIYPVGWCAHVGYKLEAPRQEGSQQSVPRKKSKRGGKKGRPPGVRRMGMSRGIENDSPDMKTVTNSSVHSNTNSSIDNPIRKHSTVSRGRPARIRKTPLGASNQAVRGTRPVRSTRTARAYTANSDEDELSDDTSSGVASLPGSEMSQGDWEEDVSNNQTIDHSIPSNIFSNTIESNIEETWHSDHSSNPMNIETTHDLSMMTDDLAPSIMPQISSDMVPSSTHLFSTNFSQDTLLPSIEIPKPYIPRLVDNLNEVKSAEIFPKSWTPSDVATFLERNDFGGYGSNFIAQNIDGAKFLTLQPNDVMNLTRMKVGPSLKVQALIQRLIEIINPAQARYQATLMKRGISFNKS